MGLIMGLHTKLNPFSNEQLHLVVVHIYHAPAHWPHHPHQPCTVRSGTVRLSQHQHIVLTVATYVHNILCILHDTVHRMLCAGYQTSAIKAEWHKLSLVQDFDAAW